jgi:hypothetical protein
MVDNLKIEKLLKAADAFCLFIETYESKNSKFFLRLVQEHLLVLYSQMQELSLDNFSVNSDYKPEKIDDAKLKKTQSLIADRLSSGRYYWHVFNPLDNADLEAVCGDLLDDLFDIYKDIKRSLLLFNDSSNLSKETAMWQFKFEFNNHWGEHCINALYAIHSFLKI